MTLIVRRAVTEDAAIMSSVLIASITSLCNADHSNDAEALAEHGHEIARLKATATARAFYSARGWRDDGPQATGRRVNGYPMVKTIRIGA